MKFTLSTVALIAGLGLAGGAFAQDNAPAKGNAPLKHPHTVNDGGPKRGANSFTQNEARKHIENSGYTGVSGLAKGRDGVWRGAAMRDGAMRNVSLDFKGNVTDGGMAPAGGPAGPAAPAMGAVPAEAPAPGPGAATAPMASTTMHHHHHHHWRHMRGHCATPGPNGVACSGVDTNRNGVSDKEDHAMKAGAKP